MRIQKIYLDLDGVLCDFYKRYREVFNVDLEHKRSHGEKITLEWNKFVEGKNFENLDWHPGGLELLKYIISLDIPVEILLVLDNQKENRFIGKLQEFDFGIDLPDVNSFIKYCEKYKVNFTVIHDLDMKEESGYHPLQRMAFTRVAEDQILLLDADTFIFDDVSPFFQALKYRVSI
mgnify:CR=1 FL=1